MRHLSMACIVALLLLASSAAAQTPQEANDKLAHAFEAAWNSHDMQAFGALLTEDVDWVNVDSYRGHGRQLVVDGHARVHATKFKESVLTITAVDAVPLSPTIALVYVTWGIRGDKNNDGTAREPREGLFTWVTIKDASTWRIRASHNTNKSVIK